MTRNTLSDLNNHLFEQMERLNDDDLNQDQLDREIRRSTAMTNVARNIIDNAQLVLRAEEFKAEYGGKVKPPKMLE